MIVRFDHSTRRYLVQWDGRMVAELTSIEFQRMMDSAMEAMDSADAFSLDEDMGDETWLGEKK